MLVSGDDILELIPQRPPFAMIDKLLSSGTQQTVSGLTVSESNLLCENGSFTESGLVENIAQTAAAGVGYVCKQENRPVPVGFIAAVKDLHIYSLPAVGAELVTEVNIKNQVMDVTIIHGQVKENGTLLAECEMRIFIKND